MAETILLTGGTGFLGTELASHLAADPDVTVYALVRADADAHAHQRLRAAWQHDRKLAGAVGQRIQPLRGDFTLPGLGLDEKQQQMLREHVSVIIHASASGKKTSSSARSMQGIPAACCP